MAFGAYRVKRSATHDFTTLDYYPGRELIYKVALILLQYGNIPIRPQQPSCTTTQIETYSVCATAIIAMWPWKDLQLLSVAWSIVAPGITAHSQMSWGADMPTIPDFI